MEGPDPEVRGGAPYGGDHILRVVRRREVLRPHQPQQEVHRREEARLRVGDLHQQEDQAGRTGGVLGVQREVPADGGVQCQV